MDKDFSTVQIPDKKINNLNLKAKINDYNDINEIAEVINHIREIENMIWKLKEEKAIEIKFNDLDLGWETNNEVIHAISKNLQSALARRKEVLALELEKQYGIIPPDKTDLRDFMPKKTLLSRIYEKHNLNDEINKAFKGK
jgi:acyl carrier protein